MENTNVLTNVYSDAPPVESLVNKLRGAGPAGLTNAELLAILRGKGSPDSCDHDIAAEGLLALAHIHPMDLERKFDKLGPIRAARIVAGIELGRRSALAEVPVRERLDAPDVVAAYLAPRYSTQPAEVFGVLALDSKHKLIGETVVAKGGRYAVGINPADVFQAALPFRPRSIIVFHNHPSGDPNASEEDKALTYRLVRAGEVLGIPVADHIVVGSGGTFFSFRQMGLL